MALASGYAKGLAAGRDPRRSARDSLARVWGEVSSWGTLGNLQQKLVSMMWGGLPQELALTNIISSTWRSLFTPSQSNPLDINPLRDLLEREIDFNAIARSQKIKVFVAATHVNTGRAVIFSGAHLTSQAVLASACLPMVFRAVRIVDGGSTMAHYPASTRSSADAAMIRKLFDLGRAAADQWLGQNFSALGHRGTVDIRRDYLDDTREDVLPGLGRSGRRERGFRPWLARLFKAWKT